MKTVAYYIGSQETDGAPIELFNLLIELPGHPVESTVSAQTLRANGVFVPRVLFVGEQVTTILPSAQNKS